MQRNRGTIPISQFELSMNPHWLLAWLFAVTLAGAAPQRGKTSPQPGVPPVTMTCPMHPDIVESSPGNCPICKMSLVPVRIETVWTCPVHSVIAEDRPGVCPIDHRDLIQMTVAVTFTCAAHPEINQIDRGTCPDGTPMVKMRTLRAHGNHNPQHGGLFFMAPDNTHHLEGTFPRARIFRLYLYDDYARPLPAKQIKDVKARVVTKETFDAATRTTKEIAAFPLVKSPSSSYLEARVDRSAVPAQMTAKVQFKSDAPEYRFDFTFAELSKKPTPPAPAPPRTTRDTSAAGRTRAPATTAAASPASPPVALADPSQFATPIPDTVDEVLAQLKMRSAQIGELVQSGAFGAIWVPAFQAKDLTIALETRLGELSALRREAAEPAIKQLVRTAWLLDAFGDVGNRQQIVEAYAIFASAVTDVVSAFSARP